VPVGVSAHGSANDRNCALASTMRLTMPKQIEGAAGEAVNPRHSHPSPGARRSSILRSWRRSLCARYVLAVDVAAAASGGAELVELGIEGLPVGRNTGIADEPFSG
jgi:hypothetical protein